MDLGCEIQHQPEASEYGTCVHLTTWVLCILLFDHFAVTAKPGSRNIHTYIYIYMYTSMAP